MFVSGQYSHARICRFVFFSLAQSTTKSISGVDEGASVVPGSDGNGVTVTGVGVDSTASRSSS